MKYRRENTVYECEEAKYRQEVIVRNVIKWANPGDWVCYPLSKKGVKVNAPFIAQPEHFYKFFHEVRD